MAMLVWIPVAGTTDALPAGVSERHVVGYHAIPQFAEPWMSELPRLSVLACHERDICEYSVAAGPAFARARSTDVFAQSS